MKRIGFKFKDGSDRLLQEPVSDGPSKGFTVKLDSMLAEYYTLRDWDKNGVPKPEKLRNYHYNSPWREAMIDQRLY